MTVGIQQNTTRSFQRRYPLPLLAGHSRFFVLKTLQQKTISQVHQLLDTVQHFDEPAPRKR